MERTVKPGRPTAESPVTRRVQVKIPLELYARVETFAVRHKMPVSEAIRRLVHRGLNPHYGPET